MVRWLAWDRVALRPRRSPVATSHGRRSGCDPRWTPHGHCHWSVTRVVAGSRQRCRCAPALSGRHLRILVIAIGAHLHPSELDRHSASHFYSHCVFLSCFSITPNYSLPHAHPATSSLLTRTAPSASSSFTCIFLTYPHLFDSSALHILTANCNCHCTYLTAAAPVTQLVYIRNHILYCHSRSDVPCEDAKPVTSKLSEHLEQVSTSLPFLTTTTSDFLGSSKAKLSLYVNVHAYLSPGLHALIASLNSLYSPSFQRFGLSVHLVLITPPSCRLQLRRAAHYWRSSDSLRRIMNFGGAAIMNGGVDTR